MADGESISGAGAKMTEGNDNCIIVNHNWASEIDHGSERRMSSSSGSGDVEAHAYIMFTGHTTLLCARFIPIFVSGVTVQGVRSRASMNAQNNERTLSSTGSSDCTALAIHLLC